MMAKNDEKDPDIRLTQCAEDIWKNLESEYGDSSLGELAEKSQGIEAAIRNSTKFSLAKYFQDLESSQKAGPDEFIFNGGLYSVKVGPKVNDTTLDIWVVDAANWKKGKTVSNRTAIHGIGQHDSFELHLSKSLSDHLHFVTELISRRYATAYRWLETKLLRKVGELEQGFTESLYDYMTAILGAQGKEDLASNVWFSIFSKTDGYYALSKKAIVKILSCLTQREYSSDQSPFFHAATLVGLKMPYEKSFSQHAIKNKSYKEFELIRAAYLSDMSHIYKTEEQMTQGGAYAIFPISKIGDRELVASFPSTLKESIVPILEAQKARLEEIYKKETDSMRKHIQRLKNNFGRMNLESLTDVGMAVGAILGAAAGAFTKEVSKP